MKKSITWKLFYIFLIFQIVFCSIFMMINYFFMDDIFIRGNRISMNQTYHHIIQNKKEAFNSKEFIRKMVSNTGASITMIDLNKNIINSAQNTGHIKDSLPKEFNDIIKKLDKNKTNKPMFEVTNEFEGRGKALFFSGKLGQNRYVIMKKNYGILLESMSMAFRFILISTGITFLLGIIFVFILSKKLTDPIKNINEIAQDISNLNFDKKLNIKSEDELGELSASMNLISLKLSDAIFKLEIQNDSLKKDLKIKEEVENMRKKFISSVSHELKNPISMIQGYADGLKHNIPKTKEDKMFYYDVLIDESKKMAKLIQDLLDLSSYESGVFKINKIKFNISKLLRDIVQKNKNFISKEDINLVLDCEENLFILADSLRIEQAITNFITNANKNVSKDGLIKINLEKIKSNIKLSVYNEGCNILEEDSLNIWSSFYKINKNNSEYKEGRGLGLAIVRAIIDLHQGSYGVINHLNGVEFWFEIPIYGVKH